MGISRIDKKGVEASLMAWAEKRCAKRKIGVILIQIVKNQAGGDVIYRHGEMSGIGYRHEATNSAMLVAF